MEGLNNVELSNPTHDTASQTPPSIKDDRKVSSLQTISSIRGTPESGGVGGGESASNECADSFTSSLGGGAPSTIVSVGTINTGVSTVVRRGDGGRIPRSRRRENNDSRSEDLFALPGVSGHSVPHSTLTEEPAPVVVDCCCCCLWRKR